MFSEDQHMNLAAATYSKEKHLTLKSLTASKSQILTLYKSDTEQRQDTKHLNAYMVLTNVLMETI